MTGANRPATSLWIAQGEAEAMLAREGFDREDGRKVLLSGVEGGRVGVRAAGRACPPDKLRDLRFDFDRGTVSGWNPSGIVVLSFGIEGEPQPEPAADDGLAYELNGAELAAYLAELRRLDAPAQVPRGGTASGGRDRGGRPPEHLWAQAMMHLAAWTVWNGVPDAPAPFAAVLREWFAAHATRQPDDREIRRKAREQLDTHHAFQREAAAREEADRGRGGTARRAAAGGGKG